MTCIQYINKFFRSFFELLTFRTKPRYKKLNKNNDVCEDYEFIILNEEKIIR